MQLGTVRGHRKRTTGPLRELPGEVHLRTPAAHRSSTFTFLFTDVEGSTVAWLRNGRAMSAALARHDELIERCVATHHGMLVRPRGEGDSRFAVFVRASDAVAAACASQVALLEERWALVEPLRVRIGVHTGEVDQRLGDYYGPAVNHCARLRSLAYGGQVLVSAVTADLVREALSADLHLRDLGMHQLKDLEEPERVWQLEHPRLPADFPPLHSVITARHNLPNQHSSLVGRAREAADLQRRLGETRLLTLTGVGGVGKTRLALAVAHAVSSQEGSDVRWVELASLTDPGLVPQVVANALQVREQAGRQLLETLVQTLRSWRLLIVLDNCEHLVQACSELVDRLLTDCPGVRVLATGRERLRISGEAVFRVAPLEVPSRGKTGVHQASAVRLFVERAAAAMPDFCLTDHNAQVVSEICTRLDGIPLAIELAAARVGTLGLEQIIARLDDRFRLLSSGGRTAAPRQQTMRGAVQWSYDLLSPHEQWLFERASVFAGGWTLEAAEAVCTDDDLPVHMVPDLLAQLVDKSMVVTAQSAEGITLRYSLLDTLRAFGRGD